MTRDHVLFWLNDRCGSVVNAEVAIGRGDYRYSVLAVSGVLRRWPEGPAAAKLWVGDTREGVEGVYSVGDGPGGAALDLSDVPADADAWESADRDEVGVALAEGVWLRVVVGSMTAEAWSPGWPPKQEQDDDDDEHDLGGES